MNMSTTEGSSRENSLEKRNQALIRELVKLRTKPSGRIGYLLLVIGAVLLSVSLDYSQSLAAFLSLAFLFWGILFLYVKPDKFVRKEIMLSMIREAYNFYYDKMESTEDKDYLVYYSPTTITEYNKVYTFSIDTNNNVLKDIENNDYKKTNPLGIGLIEQIEADYKITVPSMDSDRLMPLMKKIYEDDYDLVKKYESEIKQNSIEVKLDYYDDLSEIDEIPYKFYIVSSIACAIAKNKHKPIIVDRNMGSYELVNYEIYEEKTNSEL